MPYFPPPSSRELEDMIRRAEARADADVEQARLQREHRAEQRQIRALENAARARYLRRLIDPTI